MAHKSVGLIAAIKKANAPLPPENSVTFRIATALCVVTGIVSCASVGELSPRDAALACAGTLAGMVFSYLTRARPWGWVKVVLAIAVLGVFASFIMDILSAAQTGQLSSVEIPLASLFTWVQLVHSFDVPARRDLLFSLAAAAALLSLGAAQAVSVDFVAYVALWLVACLVALGCSWRSMTGGAGQLPIGSLALVGAVVVGLGTGLLIVLPAPRASQSLSLPASLTSYLPLRFPTGLTGTGSLDSEPAQAANASGRIGVGGYLGFASELDTALRGALGDEVVMRVRADQPGYFLGMTYDTWNGQDWKHSLTTSRIVVLKTGSPFEVNPAAGLFNQAMVQTGHGPVNRIEDEAGFDRTNIETFYVTRAISNLIFSTPDASQVYFPAHSLVLGGDGSIRSTIAMSAGTVYTVVAADTQLASGALAKISGLVSESVPVALEQDLQLPAGRYGRVASLARRIVRAAHATTTYAKVTALEAWMGAHLRYSTDIPPLRAGQDAVEEFLFGSRVGYCEQISTALAVMARTLHIPTREAIGYVPGPFDPLSDTYQIQAKDAHAWVQVWFPGIGWQNFDPTTQVPLATPDPGAVLLSDLGHGIARLPWKDIAIPVVAAATLGLCLELERRRRMRPAAWEARIAAKLERVGSSAGVNRLPVETLSEYASKLQAHGKWRDDRGSVAALPAAISVLERAAYTDDEPDSSERAFVESVVSALRPVRHSRHKPSRKLAGT